MYIKKVFLLALFLIIFILNINNLFALNKANLTVDNNKIDINDYLRLNIIIETNTWWNIWVEKINWLEENFDIVWQSQSQSNNSQTTIINWKTQDQISIYYNIILELKAKKKWSFEIWPVNITEWNKKIKTNSVKVEITWDKLFMNGNHLKIPQGYNWPWNNQSKIQNNSNLTDEIENFSNWVEKKDFKNSKTLYLFLTILVIVFLSLLSMIMKSKKFINKDEDIISKHWENHINSFENIEEIIYPSLEDEDFISKLDNILKIKLANKHNICNIKNQTYLEILNSIDDLWELSDLDNIIKLLTKAKYSNNIMGKEKNNLINLIKNI